VTASRSRGIAGRPSATSTRKSQASGRSRPRKTWAASFTTAAGSAGSRRTVRTPDSMRENSRTRWTMRSRRPASRSTTSRHSLRSSSVRARPSRRVSTNIRIEVSGVFRSWETAETKSAFTFAMRTSARTMRITRREPRPRARRAAARAPTRRFRERAASISRTPGSSRTASARSGPVGRRSVTEARVARVEATASPPSRGRRSGERRRTETPSRMERVRAAGRTRAVRRAGASVRKATTAPSAPGATQKVAGDPPWPARVAHAVPPFAAASRSAAPTAGGRIASASRSERSRSSRPSASKRRSSAERWSAAPSAARRTSAASAAATAVPRGARRRARRHARTASTKAAEAPGARDSSRRRRTSQAAAAAPEPKGYSPSTQASGQRSRRRSQARSARESSPAPRAARAANRRARAAATGSPVPSAASMASRAASRARPGSRAAAASRASTRRRRAGSSGKAAPRLPTTTAPRESITTPSGSRAKPRVKIGGWIGTPAASGAPPRAQAAATEVSARETPSRAGSTRPRARAMPARVRRPCSASARWDRVAARPKAARATVWRRTRIATIAAIRASFGIRFHRSRMVIRPSYPGRSPGRHCGAGGYSGGRMTMAALPDLP
jgi:hypothetical protein